MKKLLMESFFICLLVVTSLSAAVDDTIIGTVLDTLTAYPIDSVTVSTSGVQTLTKKDGTFRLIIPATVAVQNRQMQITPWVVWDPITETFTWPVHAGDLEIRIHDIGGKMLMRYSLEGKSGNRRLSLASLPKGVFVASFMFHGKSVTRRFMNFSDRSSAKHGSIQTEGTVQAKAASNGRAYDLSFSREGYIGKSMVVSTSGGQTSMQVELRDSVLHAPWDWAGVVGTGQSLSVGARASAKSTTQPFQNLKMSTGNLSWPINSDNSTLKMVPLVEPVGRRAPTYPSSWPENISQGETPHSAMGNQITALFQAAADRDYISVQGCFGEDGQCMEYLKKNPTQSGLNGRAFEASLIETRAVTRLAKAAGKTYGVGAIIITHGECDASNVNYGNELRQLWSDYNTDLAAITGQSQTIPMLVSQQNSARLDHAASIQAQWKVSVDYPGDIICTGPKYQLPYFSDNTHLNAEGYQQLGEKYAQVYFHRVILGHHWQPLMPIELSHSGQIISVRFHVPVPPMVWNTSFQKPHQNIAEWKNGKGFEVRSASGSRVTINSVEISGDSVLISCASPVTSGMQVGYAQVQEPSPMSSPHTGTRHWGLLHDSDPFVGYITKTAQPNWAVAFDLTVP